MGIKGVPIKAEAETDTKATADVLKKGIDSFKDITNKSIDTVKETFVKVTDDLKETSDARHQHRIEIEQLKMKKDKQEHEQKMEIKEFKNDKKGLFDKWSEHQLQKKELNIKEKELMEENARKERERQEEAERKKKILNIIEIVAVIFTVFLVSFLIQKLK